MKVVFVLDDLSIFVSSVEEIQLRQLEEGLSGLVIPSGKNAQGEDLFRPLITYPVNLAVPRPKPAIPAVAAAASLYDTASAAPPSADIKTDPATTPLDEPR